MARSYIPVRRTNLKYYKEVELFYKSPSGNMALYKPAGMVFTESMLDDKPFLGDLYILPEDKAKALKAAQDGFSKNFGGRTAGLSPEQIKLELVNIVDETLMEPRTGGLKGIPGTVDVIIEEYSRQPAVIKNLAMISHIDYSTAIHAINVMALTIGYCFYTMEDPATTRSLGIAALLHDIGKIETPLHILTASRKLSAEEFAVIREHPAKGESILEEFGPGLPEVVAGCKEHHEKTDGSGYPLGISDVSYYGRVLGIIDCYEAITNDERPYRNALQPIDALSLLKKDVDTGKFDSAIFENFAYSLTNFKH